jgi:hypothetical protein
MSDSIDKITKQKFTQESREKWSYVIRTQSGKDYLVQYEIKPFGYCSEKLSLVTVAGVQVGKLIWDREYKVGERFSPTVFDMIEDGKCE